MTYSAVYCALITKRLNNPITKDDCYVEKHHIIPRAEGGDDDPQNLVNLTAREHYIAHLLLAKIYNDYKMWSAVTYMMTGASGRNFKFNSHLYKKAREEFGKQHSRRMRGTKWSKAMYEKMKGRPSPNKGKPCPVEQRKRISEKLKGRKLPEEVKAKMRGRISPMKGKHLTEEQKRHLSNMLKGRKLPEEVKAKLRGRPITDEYRRKMSEIKKGHPTSEETKRKISEAKKGKIGNTLGTTWFNNGLLNIRTKTCPEGFVKGRLKK